MQAARIPCKACQALPVFPAACLCLMPRGQAVDEMIRMSRQVHLGPSKLGMVAEGQASTSMLANGERTLNHPLSSSG